MSATFPNVTFEAPFPATLAPQSNGGVATTSRLTLYGMQSVFGGGIEIHAFDPSGGYNDPNIGGFYSFKV